MFPLRLHGVQGAELPNVGEEGLGDMEITFFFIKSPRTGGLENNLPT